LIRWLRRGVVVALAVYLLIAGGMFFGQRMLLYKPERAIAPLDTALLPQAERVEITTKDGERLKAWWIAPRKLGSPVFLYLHGNAGNLEDRAVRFSKMVSAGEGLFAIDWRGYGGSTGSPSQSGLMVDAEAAYAWLAEKTAPSNIVVFGESLGSFLALHVATQNRVKAVVLDSPFLSVLELASSQYPWLPVSLLLKDPYRSDLLIEQLQAPLLVLHGDGDRVVPFAHGEALYTKARAPKQFQRFEGGEHIVSYKRDGEQVVRSFLRELPVGAAY
jgi:uncharacterized protein